MRITALVAMLFLVVSVLLAACQGDVGSQGAQGPIGPPCSPGKAGEAGPAGPQGERGLQGAQGAQGLKGTTGVIGAPGAPGPEGPPGPAGLSAAELPPRDQSFSLAVTDDAGTRKNGADLVTLKFGGGTPDGRTVVAKKGNPTIDGVAGDSEWGVPSTIRLAPKNGGGGPSRATMQAAYDDYNIYLLVTWEDPTGTKSIDKNMLTYDAASDIWSKSGNEDRVFFLWNINATDFAPDGCSAYCHAGEPAWDEAESKMGTNYPGEKVDVWHWKAGRTNAQGHADDKHWVDIDHAEQILYEGVRILNTRLADTGSSFAAGNVGDGQPKSMNREGRSTDSYLWDYQAVPFDPNAGWQDGDTVPGYVLSQLTGSNADVIAKSGFSDGTWVVEFKRVLITYDTNDVQFK